MTKRDELIALDPAGLEAAVRECARITAPEISDVEYERIKADNSPRYQNTRAEMERTLRAYLNAARSDAPGGVEAPAAGDGEPVAWRWQEGGWGDYWIYNPEPGWLAEQNNIVKQPLFTAPPADAAMREALEEIEGIFEQVRLILINHLDEPERSAFWKAVEGRDKCRAALTAPGATTKSNGGEPANWREIEMMRLIDLLRSEEGDSVTILCDNPDPRTEAENNAVICNGGWTNYKDRRFNGVGVLDALSAAMIEYKRPKSDGGDLALAAECAGKLCEDCPPVGYPTDKTRCSPCPRRTTKSDVEALAATTAERPGTVTSEPEPSTSDPSSTRSEVTVEGIARIIALNDREMMPLWDEMQPRVQRQFLKSARALLDQFEFRRK